MANPPTFPSDGRITSLQNYTAALVGTELLPLVAPGNATAGINYNITVTQMLSGLLPALPQQNPNVVLAGPASGVATATPTFRSLVLADLPGGTASFPLVGNGIAAAPSFQALSAPGVSLLATSNALATTVSITNATAYFTGPSVAQGTIGVWFVTGGVTVLSGTSVAQAISVKLWDGATVISSGTWPMPSTTGYLQMTLSGVITNPSGNLNVAVLANPGTAIIENNFSNGGKDSTITAIRIG